MTQSIEEAKWEHIKEIVGVDRGVNFLLSVYDSQDKAWFIKGRHVKDRRAHYKQLRRHLQQRQTPSARQRLNKIGQRRNPLNDRCPSSVQEGISGMERIPVCAGSVNRRAGCNRKSTKTESLRIRIIDVLSTAADDCVQGSKRTIESGWWVIRIIHRRRVPNVVTQRKAITQ